MSRNKKRQRRRKKETRKKPKPQFKETKLKHNERSLNLSREALNKYLEGDLEKAVELVLEATRNDPDYFYGWFARGNVMSKVDTHDSEMSFKRALDIKKTDTASWNNLGLLYERRGDVEKAKNYYLMAISVDPECVEVMINLANCERSNNNFENAEKLLIRVLELKPDYMDAKMNLAAVLAEQHKYISALGVMDELVHSEKGKDNSTVWQNYGFTLAQCGETEAAVLASLRALEINSRNHLAASNMLLDMHYRPYDKQYAFDMACKFGRIHEPLVEDIK